MTGFLCSIIMFTALPNVPSWFRSVKCGKNAFRPVQLPRLRAVVGALCYKSDRTMREKREFRDNDPAHAAA